MNAYIVAVVGGKHMVPVSKLYKTYKSAKIFRDYYVSDIDDKDSVRVLQADNWHLAKDVRSKGN